MEKEKKKLSAAEVQALIENVKELKGRLDVMEEERSQRSAPSTSPSIRKESTFRSAASVFKETLQNYGAFGKRLKINDLRAEDGAERSGVFHAGIGRAQQERQTQAPPQVAVGEAPIVGKPARDSGGFKILRLSVSNFSGKELYPGLDSGFQHWAYLFIEALEIAKMASDFV